ncbi:MAG TPA: acyltransferase, partial [Candidatus Kapabacteria bacterium]|nr:acyltransferase [Candidatus Kapabacteria bacterium]
LRRAALSIRKLLLLLRTKYLIFLGMDIHPDTQISLKANLDHTNPRGIHIDQGTLVAFGVVILAHDLSRVLHSDTYIGKNCFIGAHVIILPGVRVGDGSIVATGSVVTKDVEPNSIVAGNPARVIKRNIVTQRWGVLEAAYREALALQIANEGADNP